MAKRYAFELHDSEGLVVEMVRGSDYDAIAAELACVKEHDDIADLYARVAALEAFLVKVLPAGIEDVCDECGGDLAKCKAENPDCYIAEARRLLPPATGKPV